MRRVLIALAVATMVMVSAQVAFAAVSSDVSIRYNSSGETFHGMVTSSNDECAVGRPVKLFKKTSSGAVLQGKTKTNANGVWRVPVMHAHGKYFATAPEYMGMHKLCAASRSRTIDVM
ncbi:MAG TPA: hypothetical protein VJM84_03680 [Actinomycetota bacterium]|nr:hypothetical protein [Actinomycetota bacterium]